MAIPGNLLTPNQEGFDTDTSGWATGAGTITRDTSRARTGAASLKITSAGAGDTFCYSAADLTGLVPGTTYTIYAWVYTTHSGLTAKTGCDWKTATGTYISDSQHAGQALAPNTWTRVLLVATAPAGAERASLYVPWYVATARNQVCNFDDMFFGVPQDAAIVQGWGVPI